MEGGWLAGNSVFEARGGTLPLQDRAGRVLIPRRIVLKLFRRCVTSCCGKGAIA